MATLGVSQAALAQVCPPTPTPTPPYAPTPTPSCGTCVLTTPTYTPAASPTAIATPAAFSASLPSTTTQAGTGQFQNVQTLNMTANNAAIPTLNAGTVRTRQIWKGELGWQEALCDVAASNDPEMGMLTVALPLATPGTVGVPGQLGDIVQFVIIHPVTGQATATSVRL